MDKLNLTFNARRFLAYDLPTLLLSITLARHNLEADRRKHSHYKQRNDHTKKLFLYGIVHCSHSILLYDCVRLCVSSVRSNAALL